jgi:hypothetical protein
MAWYQQKHWNAMIHEHSTKNTFKGLIRHLLKWIGDSSWNISPSDETHDVQFPICRKKEFLRYLVNMFMTNNTIPPKMYRCLYDLIVYSREPALFVRFTQDFDYLVEDPSAIRDLTEHHWIHIESKMKEYIKDEIMVGCLDSYWKAYKAGTLGGIIDIDDIRRSHLTEDILLSIGVNQTPDDIGEISTELLCNGTSIKDEAVFRKHFDEKLKNKDMLTKYLNVVEVFGNQFIVNTKSNLRYLRYEDVRQILLQPCDVATLENEYLQDNQDFEEDIGLSKNRFNKIIIYNILQTNITFPEYMKLVEEFPMCDYRKYLVDDYHDSGMRRLNQYYQRIMARAESFLPEQLESINRQSDDIKNLISDETIIDDINPNYFDKNTILYTNSVYMRDFPHIEAPLLNKNLSFEEFKEYVVPLVSETETKPETSLLHGINIIRIMKIRIVDTFIDVLTHYTGKSMMNCNLVRDYKKYVEFFIDEWNVSKYELHRLNLSPIVSIEDVVENLNGDLRYRWVSLEQTDRYKYSYKYDYTMRFFSPENVEKYPDFPWEWECISKNCVLNYDFIIKYRHLLFKDSISRSVEVMAYMTDKYKPWHLTPIEVIDEIVEKMPEEYKTLIDVSYGGLSTNTNITIPWFIDKVESGVFPLKKWSLLEVLSSVHPDKNLAATCIQSWWRLEQSKRRHRILAGEVNEWWFSPDCFPASRVRRLAFESRYVLL